MTPQRWQLIDRIFKSAIELPQGQRTAFLVEACDDDELRAEVEALVSAHEKTGEFLDAPAYKVAYVQPEDDPAMLTVGQTINHYKVLGTLGVGGMGEVYLAQDTRLGRKIALKLLPARLTRNRERLRRFEQEARAASALNHPNIITIHEIGQADGMNFIVTEFIEGQTIRQLTTTTRIKLTVALDVATQVASALDAAHAAGIVHRDLKPENIMLRPDGVIKVLDFGLAKLTESPISSVDREAATVARVDTEIGTVMGTAQYMSPEQARGLKVDARTDIFSLGVLLYEMLAGRAPFGGATTADIIGALLHKEPQSLSTLAPDVPADLQHIISKAVRKDRDERYQNIKSLLTDLRTLKQELDFSARLERNAPEIKGSETATPPANSNAVVTNPETRTTTGRATSSAEYIATRIKKHRALSAGLVVLLLVGIALSYWLYNRGASSALQIESIAVLPFVNESGNSDVEYLSDGMTESLIISLSRLPQLSVKARSSVFRYKGKQVDPRQVAAELSVQAILNGRVVQHGDDLTLYLSLVDARNGNQIWGEQYDRKLSDLVLLQSDVAREVSQKLRARLSNADEQKVAKNYTENVEAYQLYLKGRYHVFKITPPEVQKGISYFQEAIAIDPSYALAYVGLSAAYRSLSLSFDMPPTEGMLKAKTAAQKAVDIDDTLSEAHTALGWANFWYDWDFNAAENQYKRALELGPNNSDAHWAYGHLLSNEGRHAEGLAEIKRARELDPLNLIVNTTEGQMLLYAGQPDNALATLQKTFELDSNLWFTHMVASSAYIEKGMFEEALGEARKAEKLNEVSSIPTSLVAYALARSGKQAEARAVFDDLLKSSNQHYVPPYQIAMVYGILGKRDEAFAMLERSFKEREPKMVFLKVDPKWNSIRDDPRFQDLLRRVGF